MVEREHKAHFNKTAKGEKVFWCNLHLSFLFFSTSKTNFNGRGNLFSLRREAWV